MLFALLLLAAPPEPVAATVNGDAIPLSAVDAELSRRPAGGPLTATQRRDLRKAVAEEMIDDLLLKQFLKKHAPSLPPGELDKHLTALTEAQRKVGRTMADFYRETGQTEATAKATWTMLLQFRALIDKQATDAELRKYHAAYKAHFDGVEVRASHILVRVPAAAPPGEWERAKLFLLAVREDIVNGKKTFTAAAERHSDCPSASRGGDLGYLRRKDSLVDEPFARAAFELKADDVSEPVVSEIGVHLIRVTGRKPGTLTPFETVREAVKDCYADDVRQTLLAKLRKEATISITVPD